jgi:Gas vesicle synthesis protein GvpL/GvpF
MLYIYGVTRADRKRPSSTGLGEPPGPVRLIESGPVAAAVGDVPQDYVVHDEDARTHLQVLIGLLGDGPVLPVRLGTVAPDDDAVRHDVLDAAQPRLVRELAAVDGFVELHVDADDDEAESIAAISRTVNLRPSDARDLTARIQLGEQIAGLLVDYRRELAEQMVAELRPLSARDTARSSINNAEDPLLRWAFLVAHQDVPRFDQAVVAVRTKHPELAIRYAGPLPPSHFVDWQPEEPSEPTDSFQAQGAWGWD